MRLLVEEFQKERFAVAMGLSTLKIVAMGGLKENPLLRIAVPDNLMRLVRLAAEGSEIHKTFLTRIMNYYDRREVDASDAELISGLDSAFRNLSEIEALIIITDNDVDKGVAFALEDSFSDEGFEVPLSQGRNFVREYFTRMISWSKKADGLIIEKSRQGLDQTGHYIATLQLPDKFGRMVDSERKHLDGILSFRGGKGGQWFIALASDPAGLAYPLAGAPVILIATMNP